MQITRRGRIRNAGTDILSEQSLDGIKVSSRRARWDGGHRSVLFQAVGRERGNGYLYSVALTVSDLVVLVEAALNGNCSTKAERALMDSALSAIKGLIVNVE